MLIEQPGTFHIPRRLWLAAALVAGCRVKVNDAIRAADRDRGASKNQLNDLQGVLGELVGKLYIRAALGVDVADDLFDIRGPVDNVDLVVDDGAGEIKLESKCHLFASGKRLFLINQRAHERSHQRGAHGYLPVLATLGREHAIVGTVVGVKQVDAWGQPRRFDDPAIGIELDAFCDEYADRSARETEVQTQGSALVVVWSDLQAVMTRAERSHVGELSVESLARQAEAIVSG